MLDTLREFFHIAAHLFCRYFGVDLRRADAAVSEHLRERFNRHVVRQAHRRRVGVAAHVEYTRQSKEKRTGEDKT